MAANIAVEMTTDPAQADEFARAFIPLSEQTRVEDAGCEAYELFRSVERPEHFVLIERWTTAADLEAHIAAPHMEAIRTLIGGAGVERTVRRFED